MKRASHVPLVYDKCVEYVNKYMMTNAVPCTIPFKAYEKCQPFIPKLVENMRAVGHNAVQGVKTECDQDGECWNVKEMSIRVDAPNNIPWSTRTSKKTCYY